MYRIGWFSTGRDKAARQLLTTVRDSIERGEIQTEIAFVFCSRIPGESKESDLFLALAKKYGLPLICLSWQRFVPSGEMDRRLEYDRLVMGRLDSFRVDICLLAGYMLIVGPEMCRRYDMINLHPAMPGGPTGTWQEVIWQLMDGRAEET
ncbi:MAG: phosphoribosylglycinamide transformylase, folate-dependent, partial [Dehalococcoidia bacterium]|nr:phosphoribosylglycinamide transformylase, folate-dependent [Dehalococcoidia bacterium]